MTQTNGMTTEFERERQARLDAERRLETTRSELLDANRDLTAANEELAHALAELKNAQSKLVQSEKLACIGQLAAGVAHEVNNPVGYVSSNLNTLGEYVADLLTFVSAARLLVHRSIHEGPATHEAALEIERLAEVLDLDHIVEDVEALLSESGEGLLRVRKIVGDLRDFSHVDGPDAKSHDINELIDKSVNVAWNELKYKTEVVKDYGELPPVVCYAGRLGQVFLNLLVNAAQAIEERGVIRIRTMQEGPDVVVEVSDDGCGMPPDVVERIFEPFFTTKDVGQGTGLGLHVAYQIMQTHAGSISVRSAAGEGTTFRLQWPIALPLEGTIHDDDSNAR